MPPRPRDEYNPEYDDDYTGDDEAAVRRAYRSEFPADEFRLPGKGSAYWGGHNNFVRAVHSKIAVEGRSLADLAGSLTIRQVKEQTYADSHWLWIGAKETDGRPVLTMHKKKRQARRILWAMYRGGAPDTRRVVHVACDRADCVNPLHMELAPRGSWQRRAKAK